MMKKLSAVIACYKDEKNIPVLYRRLVAVMKKLTVRYEIIFVNDGSPDNSDAVLSQLVKKDNHVIAVTHSRNFGSQMAFISGMKQASGDAVVLLDGDLQDPPEIIPSLYSRWIKGYDVVYGERIKREGPWYMQLAYKSFYRIFRALSYIPIPLDAGDFSLIDKKVVVHLLQFPERDLFLRGLRAWVGFKQTGVPYVRPARMFGRTTNSILNNIQWATKGIFSFSYVPLEIMSWFSLVTFLFSLVAICTQVILYFIFPDTPRGITTILIVVLFLGSIQLLAISIIGQYIAKIFEEVKQRPKYIVKKIMRGLNRE